MCHMIIGYDINAFQPFLDWKKDKPNVQFINSDAYNAGVANMTTNGIDIFIDDGPHDLRFQKRAIDLYLPKMKSGGLFVIEDVQSEEDLVELLHHVPDTYKENTKVYDLRKVKDRYDDLIVAIEVP